MENRHRSGGRDLEDRAVEVRAAARGCAIEISVAALNQSRGTNSVGTDEREENRLHPGRCDLEHRASTGRAAVPCGAVEIPIAALNQPGGWQTSVGGTARKRMEHSLDPGR